MEKKPLLHQTSRWKPKYFLSVEPSLVFYSIAFTMSGSIFENYLLFRTCNVYNYNRILTLLVHDDLLQSTKALYSEVYLQARIFLVISSTLLYQDNICETELDSEKIVSQLSMFQQVFNIFVWIIITSYAGSLIDRKLTYLRYFIFLPAVGQALTDILNVLNIYIFDWSPIVLMIYSSFLEGFSGGPVASLLLSITYVSHESTTRQRSIRVGYVVFSQALGTALGNVSVGYAINSLGFGLAFLLCVGLNCCSVLSGLIFIEDLSKRHPSVEKTNTKNFIETLTEGLKILRRSRTHNRRRILYLIFIAYTLSQCRSLGIDMSLYLFLRNKFSWGATQYGVFMFYMLCMEGIGILVSTEVLKRFQLHDTTIALIAGFLDIVSDTLWLVIFNSWHVYLIPLFGLFGEVVTSISMSLATKCVEPEEYGRLSSLFALSKLSLPLMTIISGLVYQNSLITFPTLIFVIFVFLSVLIFLIFGLVSMYMRNIPEVE